MDAEICRVVFGQEIGGLTDLILGFGEMCALVSAIYLSTGSESLAASGCQTRSVRTLATMMVENEKQFVDMFKSDVQAVDPKGGGTRKRRVSG